MKCNDCKRTVRNSFTDKLQHVMVYHPDRVFSALQQWPNIGRAIGEHIGQQTRRLVISYATKRNITK